MILLAGFIANVIVKVDPVGYKVDRLAAVIAKEILAHAYSLGGGGGATRAGEQLDAIGGGAAGDNVVSDVDRLGAGQLDILAFIQHGASANAVVGNRVIFNGGAMRVGELNRLGRAIGDPVVDNDQTLVGPW